MINSEKENTELGMSITPNFINTVSFSCAVMYACDILQIVEAFTVDRHTHIHTQTYTHTHTDTKLKTRSVGYLTFKLLALSD